MEVNNSVYGMTQPQAIESEKLVLGRIMGDSGLLVIIIQSLRSDHFYSLKHQLVYEAIERLYASGSAVDMLSVFEQLKEDGNINEVGGVKYLMDITGGDIYNKIESHAAIIIERFRRREIIRASMQAIQLAYKGGEPSDDIVSQLEGELRSAVSINEAVPISILKKEFLDDITGVSKGGIGVTGIKEFDKKVKVRDGNLVIIAARPSMGKSMFGTVIQNFLGSLGEKGLTQNLEMTSIESWKRLASHRYSIRFSDLVDGKVVMTESLAAELDKFFELLDNLFFFDDQAGINAVQIKSKLLRLMIKHKIGYLIVDHGKLLKHNLLTGNKRSDEEIGETCNYLKQLAKEIKIKVFLLWQLKRPTGDTSRRPTLDLLRGSGEIEEAADIVVFIHREDYYDPDAERGRAELIFPKNRNGATGMVLATFNPEYSRFEDYRKLDDEDFTSYEEISNELSIKDLDF